MRQWGPLALLCILLLLTGLTFASNWFPADRLRFLNALSAEGRLALTFLMLASPTLAFALTVYLSVYALLLWTKIASQFVGRLIAISAVLLCLLGVPQIATFLHNQDIRSELAKDFIATSAIDLPPALHVSFARAQFYQSRCDWTCRQLILDDVVKSYTAVHPNPENSVTYALRQGGECLGDTAFTVGFHTPGNFTNDRINGVCIIAIAPPKDISLRMYEIDLSKLGAFLGKAFVIEDPQTKSTLYRRSSFVDYRPTTILGFVKDPSRITGNQKIVFGISRRSNEEHAGSDQFPLDAIKVLAAH